MQEKPQEAIVIYHNERCSKSRAALDFLNSMPFNIEVRSYLENPPSYAEIVTLVKQLGFSSVRDLIRQKDTLYQELDLANQKRTEKELIELLEQHPILIERPIIVKNNRAVIARPDTAAILSIL